MILVLLIILITNTIKCVPNPDISIASLLATPLSSAIRNKEKDLAMSASSSLLSREKRASLIRREGSLLELPDHLIKGCEHDPVITFLSKKLPDYYEVQYNINNNSKENILAMLLIAGLQPKEKTNIQCLTLDLKEENLTHLDGLLPLYRLLERKHYTLISLDISSNKIKNLFFDHQDMPTITSLNASSNPIETYKLTHFTGNEKFTFIMDDKPLSYETHLNITQQLWPASPSLRSFSVNILTSCLLTLTRVSAFCAWPFVSMQKIPGIHPAIPLICASPFLYAFKKFAQTGKQIGSYQKSAGTNCLIYTNRHGHSKTQHNYYPFYPHYRIVTKTLSDKIYLTLIAAIIRG